MQEAREERSAVSSPEECGPHSLGISTSGTADVGTGSIELAYVSPRPASATTLLSLSKSRPSHAWFSLLLENEGEETLPLMAWGWATRPNPLFWGPG